MKIPFRSNLTQDYKDLVKKLLTFDPENRLALIEIFCHTWVKKYQEKSFPDWTGEDNDSDSDLDSDETDSDYDEEEEEGEEEEHEYYDEEYGSES